MANGSNFLVIEQENDFFVSPKILSDGNSADNYVNLITSQDVYIPKNLRNKIEVIVLGGTTKVQPLNAETT